MKISIIIVLIVGVYVSVSLLRSFYFIQRGKENAAKATPYEQTGSSEGMQILILGDSTGYGTGARVAQESLAGRIGSMYPEATIYNRSINGLKTYELAEKLDTFVDKKYDVIIVHIGGNDAIRLTDIEGVTKPSLTKIVEHTQQNANQVVLYTTGILGEAPLFPRFVSPLMTKRAFTIRAFAMQQADAYDNVTYINLVIDGKDVFADDRGRFYANDGLHPSSDGYGIWFSRLQEEVTIQK